MKLSIAYTTGRDDPRLDWIIDGLREQAHDDDQVELIVVDVFGRPAHAIGFSPLPCIVKLTETTPKPTIWQGPHRVTSIDWWALSSARNTAIVRAQFDYMAFLDDRCRLGPRWLEIVRQGERERASAIAGTYDKLEREPGATEKKRTPDSRRSLKPHGMIDCGGGWLFGCTFCLPLAWALEVNGFEEGCDGMGGEDYIFGLNLAHAGHRIDFVTALCVEQERDEYVPDGGSGSSGYKRTDKGISPHDKSHEALARFGKRKRTEFTPDLQRLRRELADGGSFPVPDQTHPWRDWYDDQLIKDM